MSGTSPKILVIDDGDAAAIELAFRDHSIVIRTPDDLTVSDVRCASLILVDYVLDDCRTRSESGEVLQPRNGLAVAAVLREFLRDQRDRVRPAIVLHTGHFEDVCSDEHSLMFTVPVVSSLHNLDWIFDKSDSYRVTKIAELANAVVRLGQVAEGARLDDILKGLLDIPDSQPWVSLALDDVVNAKPPLSVKDTAASIRYLRWLLHRVLPYPSFLLTSNWVAARLRLQPEELREVLSQNSSALSDQLNSFRYTGVLKTFLGDRWWRAGIDQWLWLLEQRCGGNRDRIHTELSTLASRGLTTLPKGDCVVGLDSQFHPLTELLPLSKAVRVLPEMWPSSADPAYMSIDAVESSPDLKRMVDPVDRYRLNFHTNELMEG